MKGLDENHDLALADKLVFAPRGLRLARFSREETLSSKTPDYRVFRGEELVAYAEVKSPRDDWLDEQLGVAPHGTIVGGARPDPIFNRIARHVGKAAKQFDAVNTEQCALNVLVFVNHDAQAHFGDLHETLTGMFHATSGERFATMLHIAERWIGAAKRRIDLYVWISADNRRLEGYIFNQQDADRVKRVCALFGLDTEKIKA